jgi:hypothetical protein
MPHPALHQSPDPGLSTMPEARSKFNDRRARFMWGIQ